MCGRYRLSPRKKLVEEYFDTASREKDWTPRYNIAPTQPIPIIRQNPKARAGIVPYAMGANSIVGERFVRRRPDD